MLRMLLRFPKGIFDGAHHPAITERHPQVAPGVYRII